MARNTLNGNVLDLKLQDILKAMLLEGVKISPITRSSVQKRLGLKSRSTLVVKYRAEMIENARKTQLKEIGFDENGKKSRNSLKEQNDRLKEKLKVAEKERDTLIEKLAMIINGIQAKGYNLEELMMPLRKI